MTLKKIPLFISLIYAVFLLWISIQPIYQPIPEVFPWQDKIVHTMLYTIFAFLLSLTWKNETWNPSPFLTISYTIGIVSIYGLLLEICQIFIPTRSFEWIDIGANILGGTVGTYCGSIARTASTWLMNTLCVRFSQSVDKRF